MTEAILIAALIALVVQQYFQRRDSRAQLDAFTARDERLLEQNKHLADQIVLLKVEPQMAVVQAIPADETQSGPAHISIADDLALAEYEQERSRLVADTRALIEQAS